MNYEEYEQEQEREQEQEPVFYTEVSLSRPSTGSTLSFKVKPAMTREAIETYVAGGGFPGFVVADVE